MEDQIAEKPFQDFYSGRRVLVTGHTGFKGGWLCAWLKRLGATVTGVALPPEKGRPSLFESIRGEEGLTSVIGDIRDRQVLSALVESQSPEIVFHLAAQSLVRRSYSDPIETFATNVLGTVNLLEAVRSVSSVRAVIIVTSDKCYQNHEWVYAYRENDPLGGLDPYSASKAGAELVTASYRASFFTSGDTSSRRVGIASARAGNVIGGGDWAEDRLIPDCIRALDSGEPIRVRNPRAVRPWQHVLEPLSGYLWLASRLHSEPDRFSEAWNFGPDPGGSSRVDDVVSRIVDQWGGGRWLESGDQSGSQMKEASLLRLDCTKAMDGLPWQPVWTLEEAIVATVDWYKKFCAKSPFDGGDVTTRQIEDYVSRARSMDADWAS